MINMKDLIKQQNQEIRKETGMIKEENESTWTILYKGMIGGFRKAKDKRLAGGRAQNIVCLSYLFVFILSGALRGRFLLLFG